MTTLIYTTTDEDFEDDALIEQIVDLMFETNDVNELTDMYKIMVEESKSDDKSLATRSRIMAEKFEKRLKAIAH